ncbi:MAG: phosphatidate cytidylyltransferase [Acetobacteraceae bacterium]|nr:phosphatidate cytidylyltransferase [Acetobacteraceae bacterium]
MAANWGDLGKRAATAAVLVPVAVAAVWLGGALWALLVAVAVGGMTWEWVRICGGRTRALPGAAVPAAVLLAVGAAFLSWPWLGFVVLGLGAYAAASLATRREATVPPAWLGFGVLYIGVAGVALVELRHDDAAGRENVLFLFLVVWASDIGAYLAGRRFGGPKLWPAVSPNKTWSGAAGGLAAAMAVGAAAAWVLEPGSASGRAALVAAALGLATQAGDLLESWIKRRFGVKDSSGLIPGHGGLLDRLDGVLAAAPAAALLGTWLGAGIHLWR